MKTLKNSKGFTLIEIIAVLVILGILAAVAVPKYIDLQDEAKKKAALAALAAGGSNVTMLFAHSILTNNGTVPSMASLETSLNSGTTYTKVGDFTVTYTQVGNTGMTVEVTEPASMLPTSASDRTKTFTINPS